VLVDHGECILQHFQYNGSKILVSHDNPEPCVALQSLHGVFLIEKNVSSWAEVGVEVKLVLPGTLMKLQLDMVVCRGGRIP
jgi:hypothetical protein